MTMDARVSRKITCLQFLCSLMIIALHTLFPRHFGYPPDWAEWLNEQWHNLAEASVSTFFFLSAYLFYRRADERKFLSVLKQKFWSLIVPYFLWNALYYGHSLLREYQVWGTFMQPTDPLTIACHLLWDPVLDVLWFVRTLLGFIVLFPLIRWGIKQRWPAWIAAIASSVMSCIPACHISYYTIPHWLPVYLMGAYLAYWHKERFEKRPQLRSVWGYVLCAVTLIVLTLLRQTGHAAYYLFWVAAPLLMWILADVFPTARPLPWWMHTSFFLFVSHLVVESYAVAIYQKIMGTGTGAFLLSHLLLPCLCAALCLVCAAILRRVCPWLYALLTGLRPQTRNG